MKPRSAQQPSAQQPTSSTPDRIADMVKLAHDGLELWYGTPDAPAPDGTTEQRQGVSVTVGVRPANPSNAVSVRYRVDGRGVETVSAPLVANDFQKRTQYFQATFPTFWSGETVEYVPVVSCEGRRLEVLRPLLE